jgi:polysaccharide pyruvyl transferase WcaK-like protein
MIFPKIKNIFLGFDFYGAGNVGDDLMLHGFLNSIKSFNNTYPFHFGCIIPHNIISQRKRFKDIEWFLTNEVNREEIISKFDYWVGVGGTPFQMTSGPWLINKLLDDVQIIRKIKIPMFMIGVGGEKESLKVSDKIKQILKEVRFIATRDEFSQKLLIEDFDTDKAKVLLGSDLAHIALEEIFHSLQISTNVPKKYDLAVTYYSETKNNNELIQVRDFLKHIAKTHSVVFVGNETRKGMGAEYDIYQSMFKGIKNLFQKPSVQYFMPNYNSNSVEDLVKHFQEYGVFMSSRYHAILTAAWAGCKVVALGRSSKIKALAEELNIPLVDNPFDYKGLYEGFSQARSVPKDQLITMAKRSRESVFKLMEIITSI